MKYLFCKVTFILDYTSLTARKETYHDNKEKEDY